MKDYHFWVYILTSYNNKVLYIGVTNSLERRISEHKQELIEGFTKKYQCKKLVYYEEYPDVNQAIEREKYLKGKKRLLKEDLIFSVNKEWKDLSAIWE